MASRRMLATSISVSEQVAALRDDFTRLLFTWMIAHADDWGVLTGSAAKVKALVMPMSDHSMSEVEAAIADMEAHELIWRYAGPDGRPWVQFRTWEEHQQGLHKRTAPKVPRYADVSGNCAEPMGYTKEIPGNSGNVRELPSEQNRIGTEEKRREEEGGGADAPTSDADAGILSTLCMDVARTAGLDAKAESLRRIIGKHSALSRDTLLLEAEKASEWVNDPKRNKVKRKMSVVFFDNWLTRAEQPPESVRSLNGARRHETNHSARTASPANADADSEAYVEPEPGSWEDLSHKRIAAALAAKRAAQSSGGDTQHITPLATGTTH